ncbi:MAG TPA: monovalent cation/H+ antiporter complex subunit F [Marmoricola sp.]|nr:monovalent cation/H+ antiporter complex subunit F [Marmoricola sp.]
MTVVLVVCATLLALATLMLLVRITSGPTMLDRVIGFDVLVAVTVCAVGLEAAVNQHSTTLPVLVALALLGFVGSVSVAAFTQGSEDIDEDRP